LIGYSGVFSTAKVMGEVNLKGIAVKDTPSSPCFKD
jgi:hypothetical protein